MANHKGKKRAAKDNRFKELKRNGPSYLLIIGVLLLLTGLLSFPPALKNFQRDAELRSTGSVVTATVEEVQKVHHSSRHSSWEEYIPTVRTEIDSEPISLRMEEYSSKDSGTYSKGQKLELMYESGDPHHMPGIKSDFGRSKLNHRLVLASVFGGIGVAMVGTGLPFVLKRALVRRRQKQASRPIGS